MATKADVKAAVETPQVGNWVELKKGRSGSNILVKGSRWLVEAIAPDRNDPNRKVCKVNNGRLGDNNQIDFLYLDEISPTERWQKGDVVQSIEDPRLIGMVTKLSQSTIKIKWAGKATEEYLAPDAIILFARMVGGDQQIISEYAFKPGDRVVADFENFKGEVFTVRECYPSGMVGVTDGKGNDRSFSGSWLTVISHQSSVTSDNLLETDPPRQEGENGQLTLWWNSDEPPDPDDFGGDTPDFQEAWRQWETSHPDLAEAIAKRNQSSEISEEQKAEGSKQEVVSFAAVTEPPVPGDFRSFKAFEEAYERWLGNLDPDDDGDDIAFAESQFTDTKEIWEQTYFEQISDWLQANYKSQELTEEVFVGLASLDCFGNDLELEDARAIAREYYYQNLATVHADEVEVASTPTESSVVGRQQEWINPNLIRAGITQTRAEENPKHIQNIKTLMLSGEWEWERDPQPEFIKAEDGYYYPISGNHRSKAVQLANQESEKPFRIFGWVQTGTIAEAQLAAIRSTSNNYHQEGETHADFRCRVEKFLGLLQTWDNETLIQELRTLQPNDKVSAERIQTAIREVKTSTDLFRGLSSRLIASYLNKKGSFDFVARIMNDYAAKERFKIVLASLSEGDWIQFISNGEERRGKVHNLSETTLTVEVGGRGFVICLNSPSEILGTIIKLNAPEPSPAPIPQRKKKSSSGGGGGSSVSRELKEKARSLGLPISSEQVFPDTSEADHDRNSSYHDVDDRPFASPPPATDYLIGFKTNIKFMNSDMIAEGLESIREWLHERGRLDLMQALTDIATEIRTL